jgi:SSS family transporter
MIHTLDLVIVIVYLLVMVAIGIATRGRQENESDYFTAERGFSRLLGVILIGLSIAATFFSGISFLVYPSVIYSNGLAILIGLILLPICAVVVGYWFLPRYLRVGGSQPYEIIERQFGYPTRALAASMFILLRVSWMGTLIYAPTVALMAGMHLPQSYFWPIVLTIGLSSTLYTTLGGIRGVIVTDAIQMVVIALGIIWPIAHVLTHLPVPFSEAWHYLGETGRLKWLNTSFSLHEPFTVWSILIGMLVANLGMYLGDQMSLQRYLASENAQSARRAFLVNIIGVITVIVMLAMVGLAMAAWYGKVPGAVAPERADDVFPHFVVSQLPAGAPGLIVAAILAATMSSMTSGINSLAGTITMDFVARTSRFQSPRQRLRFGKMMSLALGLLATTIAGVVSHLGTIFEITQAITGVFLGPLLACVVLSVTQVRASAAAMMTGMIAGTLAGGLVIASGVYILWVAPAAAVIAFAVPLISAMTRSSAQPKKELMSAREAQT